MRPGARPGLGSLGNLGGPGLGGRAQGSVYHPSFGEVLNYRLDPVPEEPDAQVSATLGLMATYVVEDASSPEVGECVRRALAAAGVPAPSLDSTPDPWEPVAAIYRFVQDHIQFVRDEHTSALFGVPVGNTGDGGQAEIVEVLVRPRDMATLILHGGRPQGDCDDYTMLLSSMLLAIGMPVVFVTVAADERYPSMYSHVYTAITPQPGVRIPLDASHGPYAGWETENRLGKRKDWDIKDIAGGDLGMAGGLAALAALGIGLLCLGTVVTANSSSRNE